MNLATELRTAADKLRSLATRTTTTLERHEVQWTDLTVSDTAAKARPMVWSQYAAAMHPGIGTLLAQLLEVEADVVAARTAHDGTEDYAADYGTNHLLDIARLINGEEPTS
jgi:hypothetical protein